MRIAVKINIQQLLIINCFITKGIFWKTLHDINIFLPISITMQLNIYQFRYTYLYLYLWRVIKNMTAKYIHHNTPTYISTPIADTIYIQHPIYRIKGSITHINIT